MAKKITSLPVVQNSPPFKCRRVGDILRIKPGPARTFVILSSRLLGLATHYVSGRTVACLGDDDCPVDHGSNPPHWQGWLAVVQAKSMNTWYLSLTPGSISESPLLMENDSCLRGLEICVQRAGSTMNSGLIAWVQTLIEPFDLSHRGDGCCGGKIERLFGLPEGSLPRTSGFGFFPKDAKRHELASKELIRQLGKAVSM